jgi:hypothetical protein
MFHLGGTIMGRTSTTAGSAGTEPERREPEIMTSGHLANIITLSMIEMIEEATKRYEAQGLGRRMAAELAAMRGTVDDVRRWHALPAIDWRTGLPAGADVVSDNGTAPADEPAEAKS